MSELFPRLHGWPGRALRAPGHPKAERGHFRLRHSLCPAKNIPFHPTNLHYRGRAVGSSAQARPSQPLLNRNCRSGKPSRKGCVARRPLKPRRYLDRVLCDLTYRCAVFRTKVCLRAIQPFRRTFLPGSPALVTVSVLHRCDIIHLLKDAVKMFHILISHRFRDALHRGAAAL